MVLPYRAALPDRLSPQLPIVLEGPSGTRLPLFGLLDTGADCCCFPVELAGPLGINLADCEVKVGGSANGPAEYHQWHEPLILEALGKTIEVTALFGAVDDPVLGREDFFDHFVVTFHERARHFDVRPVQKPK